MSVKVYLDKQTQKNIGLDLSIKDDETPVPSHRFCINKDKDHGDEKQRRVLPDGTILLDGEEPFDTTD